MTLDPGQVKSALAGLQGWQYEDGALVRGVPVVEDSRQGLVEAVARIAEESAGRPEVHLQPDLVVLRVGDPALGGITPDDVELAARLDQALVGSIPDRGNSSEGPTTGPA